MQYIKGDLLEAVKEGDVDFMVHCCNNQGVMGSGIAKQIKEQFPEAFKVYMEQHISFKGNCLGLNSVVKGVINLVGQDDYGYDGKRYGHYGYIAKALSQITFDLCDYVCLFSNEEEIYNKYYENTIKLGIPYRFASDRAGCDWEIVKELIEGILEPEFEVYIYHLEDL